VYQRANWYKLVHGGTTGTDWYTLVHWYTGTKGLNALFTSIKCASGSTGTDPGRKDEIRRTKKAALLDGLYCQ
jgi:hypothetical protein